MEQIDYVELAKHINSWVPAIAALAGVFVAGVWGLMNGLIHKWVDTRHQTKTLRQSLISEVKAIVTITEERGYLEGLKDCYDTLDSSDFEEISYTVKVSKSTSPIFDANADKIGLLDPEDAAFLVEFHHLFDSVIEDVTEGGVLYEGGDKSDFAEAIKLLDLSLKIGRHLVSKAKIPHTYKM